MKVCSSCKTEKSVEDFYWKKKNVQRSHMCKECQREYSKVHYNGNKQYYKDKSGISTQAIITRNKAWVIEYLQEHPCVDCGESDIEVLEFDHVEPLQNWRAPRVSHLMTGSLKKIAQEIAKCEVRCANCHVRRTRRMAGTLRLAPIRKQ
jgi:hypothetical protein